MGMHKGLTVNVKPSADDIHELVGKVKRLVRLLDEASEIVDELSSFEIDIEIEGTRGNRVSARREVNDGKAQS